MNQFYKPDRNKNSKVKITTNPDFTLALQESRKNKTRRCKHKHHKNSSGPVMAREYDPVKRMAKHGPLYCGEKPPW